MRSGTSFPSYAQGAVWSEVTGAWEDDFPVANLSTLNRIRTIAKATTAGARAFAFVLPAAEVITFLAMIHHNGLAGSTIQIRLWSDDDPDPVGNAGNIVHDSGVVPVFPTGAAPSKLFAQVRPYLLDEAVSARSGRIDLSGQSEPWKIGGVEISGFWEWLDVEVPREIGLRDQSVILEMPNSVNHVMSAWAPRTFVGTRGVLDVEETETTAMDFQLEKKTNKPFIFCWDMDDPSTWPRQSILVRNKTLPPPTSQVHPTGSFAFDLEEWLR